MYKLIIDDTPEEFTKSNCSCSFCSSTHLAADDWNFFKPKTNLQKRMLKVVKKIIKTSKSS